MSTEQLVRGNQEFAVPCFYGGPARTWGLTAFMLDLTLRKVIVPSMHYHAAAPCEEKEGGLEDSERFFSQQKAANQHETSNIRLSSSL